MEKTKKKRNHLTGVINRIIDNILTFLFISIFLIGVYVIYDKIYIYSLSARDTLLYSTKPAEELLKTDYPNAIGWLSIPDTLEEPFVQGEDNTEYLNKGPDGAYSLHGAIFIDSRNQADLSDGYTLFYGHHMAQYQMFGALDKFFDEEYWTEEHRNVTLTLKDESQLSLYLFGIGSIDASVHEIFNPTEKTQEEVIAKIMEKDVLRINYLTDKKQLEGKRIICLSTCQTPDSTLRTCVIGYLTK